MPTNKLGVLGDLTDGGIEFGAIPFSMHPEYLILSNEWEKFRFIMRGGNEFIEKYVEKYSTAENPDDFAKRKRITPVAGFAKAAIRDIQTAIFQRMSSIRRKDGPRSWQSAVRGKLGGVDLQGSSMNFFMGDQVLPELLSMGKVGIYVDNFEIDTRRTLSDRNKQHPYVYIFEAEDIRSWEFFLKGDELKLKQVLLRIRREIADPKLRLINKWIELFRHYWIDDEGRVWCAHFDNEGNPFDIINFISVVTVDEATVELDVDEIPLVILDLGTSLLMDVANHQIALTNMESADVGYILRSNIPVYTEQFDQKFEHALNQGFDQGDFNAEDQGDDGDNPKLRKIGESDGIRYPIGADRPDFINPSAEPITASMEKQKALKDDIRGLVNLALSNIKTRFASAESKELDERGLEASLSAIGLILEHGERKIAELWAQYENSDEQATVHYPERYSLRTDEERRKDAQQLATSSADVSSVTFRREVHKEIAEILLGGKVADSTLDKIFDEIDVNDFPTGNADTIRSDVEVGLVSRETASLARGYAAGEAEKARKEKAEVEAARMAAQTSNLSARGLDNDPLEAEREKIESQDPENNPDGKKLVRGEGQNTGVNNA
jgi:hypothetical protein